MVSWEREKVEWQRTEEVVFLRYGFVCCVRPGQSISHIRSTPGVLGLVTFGNVPAMLGEMVVETIRAFSSVNLDLCDYVNLNHVLMGPTDLPVTRADP